MDFLAKMRKLPPAPAPNDEPATIKGNISLDKKQLAVNIMAWQAGNFPGSKVFGQSIVKNTKLVEMTVRKVGMGEQYELVGEDEPPEALRAIPLEAQAVFELTVEDGILNLYNVLAGACSAYLVELGSFAPLLTLSMATGVDATGMTTAMNLIYHSSAPVGTRLRMVGTTLAMGGRSMASRCEIYDKDTSRLLVSAVHTIVAFQGAQKKTSEDDSESKQRM